MWTAKATYTHYSVACVLSPHNSEERRETKSFITFWRENDRWLFDYDEISFCAFCRICHLALVDFSDPHAASLVQVKANVFHSSLKKLLKIIDSLVWESCL